MLFNVEKVSHHNICFNYLIFYLFVRKRFCQIWRTLCIMMSNVKYWEESGTTLKNIDVFKRAKAKKVGK